MPTYVNFTIPQAGWARRSVLKDIINGQCFVAALLPPGLLSGAAVECVVGRGLG